jgi:hypothetical protein
MKVDDNRQVRVFLFNLGTMKMTQKWYKPILLLFMAIVLAIPHNVQALDKLGYSGRLVVWLF